MVPAGQFMIAMLIGCCLLCFLAGRFTAPNMNGSCDAMSSDATLGMDADALLLALDAPDVAPPQSLMTLRTVWDFVWAWAWQLGWLFACAVPVACTASYLHRTLSRAQRTELWSVQETLRNPRAAQAVLGNNMPLWLAFPSIERCIWVQNVVDSLWQRVTRATEATLITSLNPILERYRPPFLTKLTASKMNLGTKPFTFTGVQAHASTERTTLIDLQFLWNGNADIRIAAFMGPVEVNTILRNFQLRGTLRIGLGPHCDAWPCFSALSIAFVGKPQVDFELSAAKVPLDAIPGLSQWLSNFVRDTLVWLMVYPKRYVVPILDAKNYGEQVSAARPVGTLSLVIDSCDSLPKRGVFSNTSPYVTALVSSTRKVLKRTKTASKTRDPQWKGEKFSFLIYNVPNEHLTLEVHHDSHENVMSKMGNVIRKDPLIGQLELFVSTLMGEQVKGRERRLSYPLVLAGTKESQGNVTSATINFRVTFKAFQALEDALADVPAGTPTTTPRGEGEDGVGEGEMQSAPSAFFQLSRRLETSTKPIGGLLIITLDKATDLPRADVIGTSDPFVVFSIGANKSKSTTILRNLNPVWDEEQFEIEFTDAGHETLKVQVYDYDTFTVSEEIGTVRIPLAEIVQSNCRLKSSWPLNPKGTIFLELKLLVHEEVGENHPTANNSTGRGANGSFMLVTEEDFSDRTKRRTL